MLTNLVTITAYCACKLCCGPNAHNITADGHTPKQGITIAASRSISFGTKITIKEHTYLVQDRLAKRYDNRIDISFSSHKDALQWGIKKNEKVIIYDNKD